MHPALALSPARKRKITLNNSFSANNHARSPFSQNGMSIAPRTLSKKISEATNKRRNRMLWTILVVLLVLWLIGFLGHVGGGLIHLLLVIALIVLIINLVSGRRAI
jgi:hypothetical protein